MHITDGVIEEKLREVLSQEEFALLLSYVPYSIFRFALAVAYDNMHPTSVDKEDDYSQCQFCGAFKDDAQEDVLLQHALLCPSPEAEAFVQKYGMTEEWYRGNLK